VIEAGLILAGASNDEGDHRLSVALKRGLRAHKKQGLHTKCCQPAEAHKSKFMHLGGRHGEAARAVNSKLSL
jgi:hypothetical protein